MMRNRLWLPVAALLLGQAALAGYWARAAPPARRAAPKEIRTEQLVIVDHRGNRRGVFASAKNGALTLSLWDQNGRARLHLSAANTGPRIEMLDRQGKRSLLILVDSNDDSMIFLQGKGQKDSRLLTTRP